MIEFDAATITALIAGLVAVGKLIYDLIRDRRTAKREDRAEPLSAAESAAALAEKLVALADDSVDRRVAELDTAMRKIEALAGQLTEAQQQAAEHSAQLIEAREQIERLQGALVEVHDWIESGAAPPPPTRPSWLPRVGRTH